MNIKKRVLDVLKQTNYPVYYATNHDAEDDTYVIFFIANEKTHSSCDNEESAIYYKIHVQIISIGDYDDLSDNIMKLMKANDFRRISSAETYDAELNFYSKSIHFEYVDYLIDDFPIPLNLK